MRRNKENWKIKEKRVGWTVVIFHYLLLLIIVKYNQISKRMLSKKIKTDRSSILSQKDLDAYFNRHRLSKSRSIVDNKSECQSPKSSVSSNKKDESQRQTRTQNLEQEIIRLNNIISLERQAYEALVSENGLLVNQIRVQQILIQELKSEKQKLLDQVHYIRKSFEQIQGERNMLVMEGGNYRNQISKMVATLDINQQQISVLDNTNRKIIDELNFQKEMLADYKQENSMLKVQMKYLTSSIQSIKTAIAQEKQRFIKKQKTVIDNKINELRDQSSEFKFQIQNIINQLRSLDLHKEDLFSFVRKLKTTCESTRTQLSIAKSFSNSFDESQSSSLFLVREGEFRKTISNQQQKLKALGLEVTNLKKKNAELQDELKTSSNPDFRQAGPRFHTSSSYIDKKLKEHHIQIMEKKNIIDLKDEQIDRLKEQIELQKSSSMTKSEQIQRLQILLKFTQNNHYQELNFQIQQLKAQKKRQSNIIEQMGKVQASLKKDIVHRDQLLASIIKTQKGGDAKA